MNDECFFHSWVLDESANRCHVKSKDEDDKNGPRFIQNNIWDIVLHKNNTRQKKGKKKKNRATYTGQMKIMKITTKRLVEMTGSNIIFIVRVFGGFDWNEK